MKITTAAISATLSAEKAVEEIVEGALIWIGGRLSATAWRSFDGGFSINVDHAGLELVGNLRELSGQLLRRWDGEWRGIGVCILLRLLAAHTGRNYGPNQNSHGQSGQNEKYGCQAVGPKPRPQSAHARIHKMTSSIIRL